MPRNNSIPSKQLSEDHNQPKPAHALDRMRQNNVPTLELSHHHGNKAIIHLPYTTVLSRRTGGRAKSSSNHSKISCCSKISFLTQSSWTRFDLLNHILLTLNTGISSSFDHSLLLVHFNIFTVTIYTLSASLHGSLGVSSHFVVKSTTSL